MTPIRVEFCGEWYEVAVGGELSVGREADLVIDENPYLHRVFLRIHEEGGLWWLSNVGTLLSATVSDGTGQVQAWLASGARLPIVFPLLHVIFSAGSTTYDFTIHAEKQFYDTSTATASASSTSTIMPVTLTTSQKLLVLALSEQMLQPSVPGRSSIPSSADAAARLGWSMTTFNRKLDNVCDKLTKVGVPGLRGGPRKLATNRRLRLVEYAVASHLVGVEDLPLLDAPAEGEPDPAI